MFCPKCGAEMKEGYRFCSFCGSTIEPIKGVEVKKRFCSKCGAELVEGVTFCSSCGARIGEISVEKAGVGARFGSFILDWFIVNAVGGIIGFVFGFWWGLTSLPIDGAFTDILILLGLAIGAGYFTYFFGNGQTLGMKAVRIKLCGTDGKYPIGYARGFLRWIGMAISVLVIGLGFLWILIDENKQGWHDKIADTYVVRG